MMIPEIIMTLDQIKAKYIRMFIVAGNGPRQAKRNANLLERARSMRTPPR